MMRRPLTLHKGLHGARADGVVVGDVRTGVGSAEARGLGEVGWH